MASSCSKGLAFGGLCCALICASWACRDAQNAAPPPPRAPAVGPLELPVSLRSGDAEPRDCYAVELSPSELRVDGVTQLELASGKLPLAGAMSGIGAKLDASWQRPLRGCLNVSAHAMVPYQTLALVLASAGRAGISRLAFHVRKAGSQAELGYLAPAAFVTTLKTDPEVAFPGLRARSWDDFTGAWQRMNEACTRASTSNGCGYVEPSVAQGGTLKIVLRSAGQAANLEFHRAGLSAAELAAEGHKHKAKLAATREDVAQGRVKRTDVAKDLLEGEPASQGTLQFRATEALNNPSVLSAVMSPLCGTTACGAVVAGEPTTTAARVLALIGAAFPNGSPAPVLAFEEPSAR